MCKGDGHVPMHGRLRQRDCARCGGNYSFSYAKRIAREARRKAGLFEHVTMTACRHGGMTELGDAALTEAQTMALSGHKTPEAARLYAKRTNAQRVTAARRRRAWVEMERSGDKSQNAAMWRCQNERCRIR
jgi:IS5 family transposase